MSDDSEKIRKLMETAFTEAFQLQIGTLFKVYLTNAPQVEKQREFTKKGIDNAVAGYRLALEAVEKWEKE
jgi:hypothetical protein